jgi:hypothetical protein
LERDEPDLVDKFSAAERTLSALGG